MLCLRFPFSPLFFSLSLGVYESEKFSNVKFNINTVPEYLHITNLFEEMLDGHSFN